MGFCSSCGKQMPEGNHAFCPSCGAAIPKVGGTQQVSAQPELTNAGDFGNILMHGDGAGNAAITIELAVHVVVQIGLSIWLVYAFDNWVRVFGIICLVFEVIQLINTYIAAKATEITVYEYGVKGISLERPNFIVLLFWTMFKTKEFQCSYEEISSVRKDKTKFVVIKDKSGTEYSCPAQNASLIVDTITKKINT